MAATARSLYNDLQKDYQKLFSSYEDLRKDYVQNDQKDLSKEHEKATTKRSEEVRSDERTK